MRTTIKFCRKHGYVNNIFGRRIHLRGINDKNFNVRSFQERAAINAPIQSSAADIIRLAMIKVDGLIELNKIYDAKMLLQIHDELVFDVHQSEKEVVFKIVKENMEIVEPAQPEETLARSGPSMICGVPRIQSSTGTIEIPSSSSSPPLSPSSKERIDILDEKLNRILNMS